MATEEELNLLKKTQELAEEVRAFPFRHSRACGLSAAGGGTRQRGRCERGRCMRAPQVSGLAKSLQEKQKELDAELRVQRLRPQPQPAQFDDELLSEPTRIGTKRVREARAEVPSVVEQAAGQVGRAGGGGALFPGIDTSTPAGCGTHNPLTVSLAGHCPSLCTLCVLQAFPFTGSGV